MFWGCFLVLLGCFGTCRWGVSKLDAPLGGGERNWTVMTFKMAAQTELEQEIDEICI